MSRGVVIAELIAVAERWLQQRGVPHFLDDTGDFEHRLPHALIGIGLAAACTAVLAYDHDMWALKAAGVTAVLLAAFVWDVEQRRKRGDTGRYRWPRPGWMNQWIVAMIGLVVVVDAVADGVNVYVLLAIAAAVATLLAVTAATPIGSLRIAGWALGHPFREMGENAKVAAGALPLLLLTVAFVFPTSELWDAATSLSIPELVGTVGLFAGLGVAFLLVLGWARIGDIEQFADWEAVQRCLADRHPDPWAMGEAEVRTALDDAATLADRAAVCEGVGNLIGGDGADHRLVLLRGAVNWPGPGDVGQVPPLKSKARWNITVVLVFGQVVQVLAVSVVMAAFFLLFGWLTVGKDTLGAWEVKPVVDGWLGLTEQHWKVTAVLAAFAGLSYAVTASLFKDQREFFFGELDRKTLQRLGVRALYYRLRALRT